jgi:hypothetical protein
MEGIGKSLGNAQNLAVSHKERRQHCPATIDKNMAISIYFL